MSGKKARKGGRAVRSKERHALRGSARPPDARNKKGLPLEPENYYYIILNQFVTKTHTYKLTTYNQAMRYPSRICCSLIC